MKSRHLKCSISLAGQFISIRTQVDKVNCVIRPALKTDSYIFTLYDGLGHQVLCEHFNNSRDIGVSQIKNGVYFYTLDSENSNQIKNKLVINH